VKGRLQKVLAAAGVGSRRRCEDLIKAGRVTVDGHVAELGESVDDERQVLAVDGVAVSVEAREYWLLNKPPGVVSTAHDPHGRRTVVDCVPAGSRVFPVGRLDRDTTGLLLLTNDGELAHSLLHPRFGVEKEYRVLVEGTPSAEEVARLREGVHLEDGLTAPAIVEVVGHRREGTELMMVIHEGRKRQVRRMLEISGHPVLRLHRRRIDGLSDEGLSPGAARQLTSAEVRRLYGQPECRPGPSGSGAAGSSGAAPGECGRRP
jgi:23S rRNA pseudouridine2605 synthase